MMATKWGNDVFEMVDEADIDSDYDSDSVDEDTVDGSGDYSSAKPKEVQQKKVVQIGDDLDIVVRVRAAPTRICAFLPAPV